MIVGTAGHIDHGKTSLVRALTGVDTDRLKEEKARGISIELGYAYVPVEDASGATLGFVDVPGHERLVHTMVAGAGGIDFALLVVAADDGPMPQTREHLAILDLLGVAHGAVALTKIDRVDAARVAAAESEVRAALAHTRLRDAPIFALNALAGDDAGLAALRIHLHNAAKAFAPRRDDGLFRLAVDRVFTLAGHGTIAAGTVHAGRIAIGDSIVVMPAGKPARVRAIHAHHRAAEQGRAGERCALNLAIAKDDIRRGDWLADARAFVPTRRLDVRLQSLRDAGTPLVSGASVHVHLGTAHALARVLALEAEAIAAGNCALAQLVFEAPICAMAGDRFLVRDAQAAQTIAGGVVLDPAAPARKCRSPERRMWLAAMERLLAGDGIAPLLDAAPLGIALADLGRLCGVTPERLALPAETRQIDSAHCVVVFAPNRWQALSAHIAAALEAFHAQHADEAGIEAGRLRRLVAPTLLESIWRGIVEALICEHHLAREGAWLRLPNHRVQMSDGEAHLFAALRPRIAQGRFDPPWVRDLAHECAVPEDRVRTTLRKAAAQGEVHQIVRDLFYAREAIDDALAIVRTLVSARAGAVEAAAFRDAIGIGRKRAIQILEFFDRIGYTRRVRDAHVLRSIST